MSAPIRDTHRPAAVRTAARGPPATRCRAWPACSRSCWRFSANRSTCSSEELDQLYDDQFIETARTVGGAVPRRPRRLSRASTARARGGPSPVPRSPTPSATGGARAPRPSRAARPRRHRLAGPRRGVLRAARHDAVHEPSPSARARRRRTSATTRRWGGSACSTARSTTSPTPRTCAGSARPRPRRPGRYNIPNVGALPVAHRGRAAGALAAGARRRRPRGSGSTRWAPTPSCSHCRGSRTEITHSPSPLDVPLPLGGALAGRPRRRLLRPRS